MAWTTQQTQKKRHIETHRASNASFKKTQGISTASCLRIRREVRRNTKHGGVGSVHLTGKTPLRTHHTSPSQNTRWLQFGFQVYTTEPRTAEATCGCSFLGVRLMFRLKVYALGCTAGSTKSCSRRRSTTEAVHRCLYSGTESPLIWR